MEAEVVRPSVAGDRQSRPNTTGAIRARVTAIDDAIASIRSQIAAADLKRQMHRRPVDPHWFHRAKTAMRHLQRERAELLSALAAQGSRKERLKDHLIAVLRERHDAASWACIMDEAHARLDREA
jgi:hypothetical protein